VGYKSVEERSNLILNMENDIFQLTKVIGEYRLIENKKYPEIKEDEHDPKDDDEHAREQNSKKQRIQPS